MLGHDLLARSIASTTKSTKTKTKKKLQLGWVWVGVADRVGGGCRSHSHCDRRNRGWTEQAERQRERKIVLSVSHGLKQTVAFAKVFCVFSSAVFSMICDLRLRMHIE